MLACSSPISAFKSVSINQKETNNFQLPFMCEEIQLKQSCQIVVPLSFWRLVQWKTPKCPEIVGKSCNFRTDFNNFRAIWCSFRANPTISGKKTISGLNFRGSLGPGTISGEPPWNWQKPTISGWTTDHFRKTHFQCWQIDAHSGLLTWVHNFPTFAWMILFKPPW